MNNGAQERVFFAFAALAFVLAFVFVIIGGTLATSAFLAAEGVMFVAIVAYSRAAYRHGWLMGRTALFLSMVEAQRRGLTAQEWIIGEAERDGIRITDMPIEPGDET